MGTSNDLNISEAGVVTFDGISVFHGRTLTAGTGISITNGTGVAGDPVISSTASLTDYHDSRFIVSNVDLTHGANYSTIAAAITAAVALTGVQTVFIQPGTYTEDLTLPENINLCAHSCDAFTPNVTIHGKITCTSAGSRSISGICLTSNANTCLTVSGTLATIVTCINCNILCNAGTAVVMSSTNASAKINLISCTGDLQTTGIVLFNINNLGSISISLCTFTNTGLSQSNNANSAGTLTIDRSMISNGTLLSATGTATLTNSYLNCSAINVIAWNYTASTSGVVDNCIIESGTLQAIFQAGVSTLTVTRTTIKSSNTNAIGQTGGAANVINYAGLVFTGTSSLINIVNQVPLVQSNDAIKITTPGAYPYTTVPQDAVILVDTSVARTITPLASPTTGQKHVIKDSVGTAPANNITVTPSGKNIDGSASTVINVAYGSITIVFGGTEWHIV